MGRCIASPLSRRDVSRSSAGASLCRPDLREARRTRSLGGYKVQISSSTTTEPRAGYHVKGNIYMGTKAFFAAKVQGGLDELYRSIDDPTLLSFIQQKFLPCAWYD